MSLMFTRTNFITGSYAGDVLLLLEVSENNSLRLTKNPNAAVNVQKDSVNRAFIGYGYDFASNGAAQSVADLTAAGAVIADVAALQAAINALPINGGATPSEIAAVSAQVYLPNAASAATLLQEAITQRETSFLAFLRQYGLPTEPNTEERAALFDLYYQQPAFFVKTATNASGRTTQLPTNLTQALQSGNRAEAWYQIRYGSSANGSQGLGIVDRRYIDSQLFGLFANSDSPTALEALQAYQTLTSHRSTIIMYEDKFGSDPDATDSIALATSKQILNANKTYGLTDTPNAVQTLAATFAPAVDVIMSNYVRNVSPLLASEPDTFARSTDIFIAGPTNLGVNASLGDVTPFTPTASLADSAAEANSNHILLGTGDGDTLVGGLGNDILIAGAGNETLTSGLGDDTIVAGDGTDTVNLRSVVSTVDFEFQGQTGLHETINGGAFAFGAIDVAGVQVTGSTGAPTLSTDAVTNDPELTWGGGVGSGGYTYVFDKLTGALQISGGSLGTGAGEYTITIQHFNLAAAENLGYLGITLPKSGVLNFTANKGVDPPAPNFDAGSTQSYTFSTDTTSDSAQTVTLTLSGENSADFQAAVDNQVVQRNSDGTFSFELPAGQTSVSFSLTNTADVGSSGSLQLSAALSDPSSPNVGAAISNSLTQNFVEPTDDPFNTPQPLLYSAGLAIASGSSDLEFNAYSTLPVGPAVSGVGSGDNYFNVFQIGPGQSGGVNESIDGGSGNDTIDAAFGYAGTATDGGVNVINGHGGQDVIFTAYNVGFSAGEPTVSGASAVRIYANSEVDLTTAIADANLATATHQQGDLIAETNSDSTIVGGYGNDLLIDTNEASGTGGVIVAGSGDDTILGSGVVVSATDSKDLLDGFRYVGFTWSASFTDNQLFLGGDIAFFGQGLNEFFFGQVAPLPPGYEGNVDVEGGALGSADDTIFGGAGNDVIILSNGNNEVQLGVGNATVLGGMGKDTIIGGGGNNSIVGGGGSDYIADGSGNSLIVGRGGDNTLIGGSGNDTLFAGGYGSDWSTSETGNNYVDGGTGNALIYGAGGSDTLIAGDGNSSVFGGVGNEYIVGGDGNDQLIGGNGNDTIDARQTTGTDLIQAGSGNTTIYGGAGSNHIQGTTGTDLIYAGDGGTATDPTEVDAGSGSATVYGGDGVDNIFGGAGADVLYAGDGGTDANPTLVKAGTGATTIYGGAGADNLVDTAGGADSIVAGSGDANLIGSGNDTLVAGSGNYFLSGTGNLTDVFSSTSGNAFIDTSSSTVTLEFTADVSVSDLTISAALSANNTPQLLIQGTSGTITVDGGLASNAIQSIVFDGSQTLTLAQLIQLSDISGNTTPDVTSGTNGNFIFDTSGGDVVSASAGADTISAWGNGDTLTAGLSGTLIYAGGNNNLVLGGVGNDTLDALGAGTTLNGGTADEVFEVNDPTDVVVASGVGNDTILSSVSYTLPTAVDTLTLTGSVDLTAFGNSDTSNLITGNAGNDFLVAGSGTDTLVSGSGVDTLEDGFGQDTFVINNSADVIFANDFGFQDTVESSVSYVLQAPIFTLNLTGSANISATDAFGFATITGNAGNDTLIGGSGFDELVAGSGVDTLVAGTGVTTFVVNGRCD
jgi:Ca2+-binding RTX toxin-like protein